MDKIIYQNQIEYLKSLSKANSTLINEMEKYAEENHVPILDWQSVSFLEMIIRMTNPEKVLEIGTAIGYTTIRAAMQLKEKSVIHSIEKSEDNYAIAMKNIELSGEAKKIKIFKGNAYDVIPGLKGKYDLIFLDADKQDYLQLLNLSYDKLRKNGVIFVDNLLWHGWAASDKVPDKMKTSTDHIRKFNKAFTTFEGLKTSIYSIGDGIGIGIKTKKP